MNTEKKEVMKNKGIKSLEKLEEAFKSHFWWMFIIVALLPVISMSLLAFVVKWGSTIINTGELAIEFKPIGLGDYIYWYGTYLAIEVTAIFSYVLWKSSERSNKLAEEIKSREERRDNEIVRENALIVYFDLIMGLDDLRKLYVYYVLDNKKFYSSQPQKLFFSNEWIKNVAILKNILNTQDIKMIYDLYGKLLTIKSLLDNKVDTKELSKDVNTLFLEVFENRIPGVLDVFNVEDIKKILKVEYVILLDAIEVLTSTNINESYVNNKVYLIDKYYKGDILEKGLLQGEGQYFIEKDIVIFKGEFNNNKFVSGTRYVYDENNQLWYQYDIKSGKFDSEKEVILYENGNEFYKGTLRDGEYHCGKGKKSLEKYNSNDELKKFLYPRGNYISLHFMYDGHFKDGKYDGDGRIFYIKEYIDIGDNKNTKWLKDEITLCEGEFENNYLINGSGKILRKDSGVFEGSWINGEIQSGIYRSLDGNYKIENITRLKSRNEIENNEALANYNKADLGFIMFKGNGTIILNKDTIRYKGEMIGLELTGRGVEFFQNNENRIKYEGNFEKFSYNGKGTEYYDNVNHSIKFKGEFENGQYKIGKHYNENGKILYEGEFKDNKIMNGFVHREAGFKITQYVKGYSFEECVCEGKFKDFNPENGCLVIDQNNEEIGILKISDNNKYELVNN